jgi:flagellar M-ring protein FliF
MAAAEQKSLPAPAHAFSALPGGMRQIVLLVGVALSIALGIVIVLWARGPSYSLLYSQLGDRDAGDVVQALQTANIPYRLEGASIQVPASLVHDARLKLASQGLPHGTGRGLELIEESNSFGVSELMEGARYQHMLETELARTIASLQPVENARVHLAIPKQSVFVRDRRSASASVMVQLYAGRMLEEAQVAAVVHLVASSVPDLEASQITVVDQQGRLLTMPDSSHDMELSAQQFDHVHRVETAYARRIEDLLTPLVGMDRVRATVTVDMDFTVAEETRETFNPDKPAIRSEQTSNEQHTGSDGIAMGIPGALSNQPPAGGTATPPAPQVQAAQNAQQSTPPPPTSTSNQATRNFEVDRTVAHVRQPTGNIRKVNAAVVIDNWQRPAGKGKVESVPLTEDELSRFTALTREAVGFDETRGDSVNVVNAPFHTEEAAPIEAASWYESPLVRELLKQGLGALLVIGVLLVLVRPIVSGLLQAPPAPTLPNRGTALLQAPVNELPLQVSVQQRMAVARSVAAEDPRRVAHVVKTWMSSDA